MSRLLFLVTTLALLVHEGKADCSGTSYPLACELWSALQDNFGGASWSQCGTLATNSRYINPCGNAKCPVQSGLVTCNGNSQITSFNFGSDNNLVAEADISSFVSMLETYRDSYNFQSLTLKNQASLGLDECLEPCADGLTCDFTGSECTGSCTTDGICVTDAPTPAPTSAPTRKADCSGTAYPKACELWSALQDNFGGASWTECGINAANSRSINPCGSAKCPVQKGLVTCNGNNEITSFNFDSENNLVAEADISSFVSMLETYRDSYNFQTLTLQNQASLGLDECLAPCVDGLTCDFTGSECIGSCTTDGICVTDAPTPAPTPLPTARPTKKPTEGLGCNRFKPRFARNNCKLWNSLMDAFTSDDWKVCQSSRNENPCSAGACARRQGFVGCSAGRVTRVQFVRDVGLTWNPLTNVTAFEETLLEANPDLFTRLTINRQTSLDLDTCFPSLCSAISCAFRAGSVCTGACRKDGQCAP